jgi:hypothetical protein
MNLNYWILRTFISLFIFTTCNQLYSQDFYINQNSEAVKLAYTISPSWKDINIEESYDFLSKAGFTEIKTVQNGSKEIVLGKILGKEFQFIRMLIFEDKIINGYTDGVSFIQPCILCLAKKMSYSSGPLAKNSVDRATFLDEELKNLFYKHHQASLTKDGIDPTLLGDLTDFGFSFVNSTETNELKVNRKAELKLDSDEVYSFTSSRSVELKKMEYIVGEFDLTRVNVYDLNLMVDVFLLDCRNSNISVKKGEVDIKFESLPENLLGLSYGKDNDSKIELRIDPEKWEAASSPKKWYLLYHELGHDVLDLNHGSGGKMMFNFADRGYSWKEFWDDRAYMFEAVKRMKNEN